MDDKHTYKKSRHSKPRPSMDGFITPESFKRPGSLDFAQRKRLDNSNKQEQLDNFNRPDGYQSTSQPLTGSANQQSAAVLSNEPRNRLKSGEYGRYAGSEPGRKRKKTKSNSRWRKFAKRGTFATVLLIVIVGGFLGYKFARNTTKVFQGSIFGLFQTTKLKGEENGRVTILLAGNSSDDPGHKGANLTDSIALVSIDTIKNTGFIMSIPRDLWVEYGTNECSLGRAGKINAVYECGEDVEFNEPGFPKGGMGLLEKDVEQYFGLDINYYALVNYSALRDAVNAVGGVNFNVQTDDPRGLYDPSFDWYTRGPLVKLTPGTHLLDGQEALNLARARGDAYGAYGYPRADFTRTENQRKLLLSIKDKALGIGVLSNPAKVSSLSDAIGNNVETDFKTDEIRRLYDLSKLIKNSNVQSVGLADKNVNLVTTGPINGVSAVIPRAGVGDYSQIQAYIKRLISSDPVSKEAATAVILNGSGVSGLAAKQSTTLSGKGITVKSVANTSTAQASTVVIALNSKMSATKTYLQQTYKATAQTSAASYPDAQGYDADFVIILGADSATSQ